MEICVDVRTLNLPSGKWYFWFPLLRDFKCRIRYTFFLQSSSGLCGCLKALEPRVQKGVSRTLEMRQEQIIFPQIADPYKLPGLSSKSCLNGPDCTTPSWRKLPVDQALDRCWPVLCPMWASSLESVSTAMFIAVLDWNLLTDNECELIRACNV